jgi:hypothetical protein
MTKLESNHEGSDGDEWDQDDYDDGEESAETVASSSAHVKVHGRKDTLLFSFLMSFRNCPFVTLAVVVSLSCLCRVFVVSLSCRLRVVVVFVVAFVVASCLCRVFVVSCL